jgi:exonuclease VII small subunit
MTYIADWKRAKENFERATGRSKPSEKFWGAFRKSSGIEDACKLLDTAEASGNQQKMVQAEAAYSKAFNAYNATLAKALAGEKGAEYKAEVKKLQDTLEGFLATFVAKKTKARKELFESLTKQSKALLERLAGEFNEIQEVMSEVEKQEGLSNAAMVKIVDALGKNDTDKAQAELKKIGDCAKAVADQRKDMKRRIDQAEAAFERGQDEFDVTPFKGGSDPIAANMDKAEMMLFAMREFPDKGAEAAASIDDDLKKGKSAIKSGVDATQVYVAAVKKLSKRGIDLIRKLDADLRYVTGELDKADLDRINASEAADPKEKEKLLANTRGAIQAQKPRFKNIATLIEKGQAELEEELAGYPKGMDSVPAFAASKEDVLSAIKQFDDIKNELKEALKQATKIEGKL